MTSSTHHTPRGLRGPLCWVVSVLAGALIGAALAFLIPGASGVHAAPQTHWTPDIQLWLVAPFVLLLASIALMPFINERFWHAHYPDFSFLLAGVVGAYYLIAFRHGHYGSHAMTHTLLEYYSFFALVGGLYVASGGVMLDIRGRASPLANTLLLGAGAVLANVMGTTGASVVLIRPFMRLNKGRLSASHILFFILIVSNCGGCLTPIGDPPLYLGYLKGVPFAWTLTKLWPAWLVCIGCLLALFFVVDSRIPRVNSGDAQPDAALRVRGTTGLLAIALIIACVFVDPFLHSRGWLAGLPVGPTLQLLIAAIAHALAPRDILHANEFSFSPAKEVGLLFIGIFITMTPALAYLATHGHSLGLSSPSAFYFGTGALSAVLDNAPTYLNFLQVAFGPQDINADTINAFLATTDGVRTLEAISLGAVFFGALTYIGNGPNFMVRAIAEAGGIRMPSFFGYALRAAITLGPVLLVVWAIMIR